MAVFEVSFAWYNHRNPKCRNCEFWPSEGVDYAIACTNEKFKGRKWRDHNSKACVNFRLKEYTPEANHE